MRGAGRRTAEPYAELADPPPGVHLTGTGTARREDGGAATGTNGNVRSPPPRGDGLRTGTGSALRPCRRNRLGPNPPAGQGARRWTRPASAARGAPAVP